VKLPILFMDELRGFYKSKVMIILWVGLPLLAIIFRFIQEYSTGQTSSFTVISSLVVSSVAGTLSAVMLSVSIINEKNRHVYELFLIRPVKRSYILLGKFLSVYSCVAVACIVAIFVGVATDWINTGVLATSVVNNMGESLAISLSMIAVACSVGVLIGIASPSVLIGAILVIYGGNQLSVIPVIPTLLNTSYATVYTVGIATLVTLVLLLAAVVLFDRKQF
jgi:ABC-2 type transport system permease protein